MRSGVGGNRFNIQDNLQETEFNSTDEASGSGSGNQIKLFQPRSEMSRDVKLKKWFINPNNLQIRYWRLSILAHCLLLYIYLKEGVEQTRLIVKKYVIVTFFSSSTEQMIWIFLKAHTGLSFIILNLGFNKFERFSTKKWFIYKSFGHV